MTPAASSKPVSQRPSSAASASSPIDNTLEALWPIVAQGIDQRSDWMIAFRRAMHANPEASGKEFAATELVAKALREHGLQPKIMREGVGVIVDIDLGAPAPGSFIALRSELDCVKVDDDKKVPYASKNAGLCHACGHDVHTTVVLAAVLAIHESRSRLRAHGLSHNIRAIFQPAEENATGALSMIEQGAVKDVKAILAVHVEPSLDAGVIGLRKGALTSACVAFEVKITGRSGHSARPFEAIDPIPAATNIVNQFYQLCPRSMDGRHPLALTVTSITSGDSFNVIPDDAVLKGTLRAARLEDVEAVKRRMEAVVKGVAHSTGCTITIDFPFHAPATKNDPKLIDLMTEAVAQIGNRQQATGTSAVAAATQVPSACSAFWFEVPSLGAEDFAFYQEVIPGAIVRLGAAMPKKDQRMPLHSSMFDIDERALAVGAKFLARSALSAAHTL
jgi:amidohydrolase